jgi:2-polyprenyl-3-methyl-5-hydroxy-6-metoxy-1,4-benzoquinol methylase
VIREELARRGAMLRNRDLDGHPDFMRLSLKERDLKRIKEGRRVLLESVDQELVDDIFTELKKIHKTGICIGDIKYGNIIIERDSGEPYFIDFEHSRHHGGPRGLQWEARRDREIERFNLQFNTENLTRDRMLRRIDELSSDGSSDWHNPVNFGHGVLVGRPWDVESGEGRWHYILKRNLPPLSGKRVLDLGCSDAYFSVQMLRHGAREVVGIECSNRWIKRAHFVKEGFEWADSTTYNLKVLHARMEKVPTMDLGGFDLVTALYGLHHMGDELIDRVIRHVGTLTNCFFVQCNLDPKEHAPEVHLRASIDCNIKALERHGFHIRGVVAPPGYRWPLLIGSKA